VQLSIVIPTHNRNHLLAGLLDTVQGVAEEIVVRDNANGVARELVPLYPTVKWIFGPEVPVLENWRICLSAATSEFVAIPSDDDLYTPSLKLVLDNLSPEAASADTIIAGHKTIDEKGRMLGEWRPPRFEVLAPPHGFVRFQFGVPARMPSIFFRNSFLRRIGSIDTSFRVTASDSELVQRALLKGTVAFVPEVVAAYRVWPGGGTALNQMTPLWMQEIDKWSRMITPLAMRECRRAGIVFDPALFADELFATNLIAGMRRCDFPGKYLEALHFFRAVRKPWHAKLRTRISLVCLLAKLLVGAASDRASAGGLPHLL
jgi:hypothetical protein